MQHHVLQPGEYFVEMAFERPVDLAVLHRALTGMGWGDVVFDQSVPRVEVGALSLASRVAAPATRPLATAAPVRTQAAVATPSLRAPAPPAPAPAAPRPAMTMPVIRPTSMTSVLDPGALRMAPKPLPASPALAPPRGLVPSRTSTVPLTRPGAVKPRLPGLGSTTFPGGGGGGGTAPSAEASLTPAGAPEGGLTEASLAPVDGGGGGGGGGGGFTPDASPAPTEEAPPEETAALDPMEVVKDLWRRWKEWGSPFVDGPGQVRISGVDEALRVRFVGSLRLPISLNDAPGMRWLFVKKLAFSAFSELSYRLVPHPLEAGRTYEFRFLSRAKSTPTRDDVKKALGNMGFLPMKLVALKRNMRLPGRPGASLTLWYGIGQWNKADSVIIADDPFAFENVAIVPPV